MNAQFMEQYLLFKLQEETERLAMRQESWIGSVSEATQEEVARLVEKIVVYGETEIEVAWRFSNRQPGSLPAY